MNSGWKHWFGFRENWIGYIWEWWRYWRIAWKTRRNYRTSSMSQVKNDFTQGSSGRRGRPSPSLIFEGLRGSWVNLWDTKQESLCGCKEFENPGRRGRWCPAVAWFHLGLPSKQLYFSVPFDKRVLLLNRARYLLQTYGGKQLKKRKCLPNLNLGDKWKNIKKQIVLGLQHVKRQLMPWESQIKPELHHAIMSHIIWVISYESYDSDRTDKKLFKASGITFWLYCCFVFYFSPMACRNESCYIFYNDNICSYARIISVKSRTYAKICPKNDSNLSQRLAPVPTTSPCPKVSPKMTSTCPKPDPNLF